MLEEVLATCDGKLSSATVFTHSIFDGMGQLLTTLIICLTVPYIGLYSTHKRETFRPERCFLSKVLKFRIPFTVRAEKNFHSVCLFLHFSKDMGLLSFSPGWKFLFLAQCRWWWLVAATNFREFGTPAGKSLCCGNTNYRKPRGTQVHLGCEFV